MIIIKTTCGTIEGAKKLSKILIEEKLAGCVQMKDIISIYRWNNEIQQANEIELSIKTLGNLFEKIANKIKEFNKYETPEIISINIEKIDKKYEDWLINNVIC